MAMQANVLINETADLAVADMGGLQQGIVAPRSATQQPSIVTQGYCPPEYWRGMLAVVSCMLNANLRINIKSRRQNALVHSATIMIASRGSVFLAIVWPGLIETKCYEGICKPG